MWMANRPPYNFRRAMIVYNLSISALSLWLFLNFGVYGWFTKYKFRCESVDYSSNEDALKVDGSDLLGVFLPLNFWNLEIQ
ncbi:hypothetical protein CEXT_10091 [Caerostris extrusa]|uniref:Very-long-chain 3-oxoacyl-CoA synthase n=1 Tax=Caerostris extrusa TaxID=172846 RepID=A0AAV4Y3R8_CAEEX|nr:hypothetical protein CEXT_10091 [Caerostris extrusa]